jgi:Protein of unknown function (DUF1592)/Protein of unknown function (DUF1588)/Protein of unknown function (DUF1595)/Protein of unknown function (DUF1587)/Protein of unknown function (DUF1585)
MVTSRSAAPRGFVFPARERTMIAPPARKRTMIAGLAVALAACEANGSPAGPSPSAPVAHWVATGPTPLRRLTNREYLNSLADLFPDAPVGELPALPDDADVAGFDNAAEGQVPSDVRTARYAEIAERYAEAATRDAAGTSALVGCDGLDTGTRDDCATRFIERLGRRVYRRALEPLETERLLRLVQRGTLAVDFEAGIQLALMAMLQAPQFLYRLEDAPPEDAVGAIPVDDVAMATRLSYFLWASTPDDALLDAAAAGELTSEAGLARQVDRMLSDPRVLRVLWDFHRQWLGLDRILGPEHEARADSVDPSWSAESQAAAFAESRRFVEHVLTEDGHLGALLTSRLAWLDAPSAALYGVLPPMSVDAPVLLPREERAGILTRAAFLAGLSHRGTTSPPVRANALLLRLLCRPPMPPPANVAVPLTDPSDDAAPRTTRMLFDEHTAGPACQGCHVTLNGIGYGLEGYDATGRARSVEHGLPIDAHGTMVLDGAPTSFVGGVELSERLATSREMGDCAVEKWLRFALGRGPVASEAAFVAALQSSFADSGGALRHVVRASELPFPCPGG